MNNADSTSPYSVPPPPYTYQPPHPTSIPPPPPPPSSAPQQEPQRVVREEQEKQHPRRSLPSIQEALSKEQPLSYAVQPPSSVPAPSIYRRERVPSPLPPSRQQYHEEHQFKTPSHPRAQAQAPSQYASHASQGYQSGQAPRTPADASMPPPQQHAPVSYFPSPYDRMPPSPGHPARHQQYRYPPLQTPGYDHPPTMNGPTHPAYGYPNYPAHYGYAAPPPPPPASAALPPSSYYTGPGRYTSTWRSDGNEAIRAEESKRTGRTDIPGYSESVKRHLDIFDIEASVNEILGSSDQVLQFARHYAQQSHQRQRSGLEPDSMPALTEIDDMLKQGAIIQQSLARMREVVVTQQAAIADRAQYGTSSKGDQDTDDAVSPDDGKGGGFAGADAKKRRGRAAPPGRCHSCSRSETPEWRRGPDGARTLCNACGLHYAKITRKSGNKPAAGGSNLRPKSVGPGSPA